MKEKKKKNKGNEMSQTDFEESYITDLIDYVKVALGYGIASVSAILSTYVGGYTVQRGLLESFIGMSFAYFAVRTFIYYYRKETSK